MLSKATAAKSRVKLTPNAIKRLNEQHLEAIIEDGRTFGDFRKSGMVKFLELACPGWIPQCRQTVAKSLKAKYLKLRERKKSVFEKIESISITTDMYMNKSGAHFLCITAHFFDRDFELHSLIISFRRIIGSHTSRKIKAFMKKELDLLGMNFSIY